MKYLSLLLLLVTTLSFADYGGSTKYPDTTCSVGARVIYLDGIAQTPTYSADHTAESAARALSQKTGKTVFIKRPDMTCSTVWRANPTYVAPSSSSVSSAAASSSSKSSSSSPVIVSSASSSVIVVPVSSSRSSSSVATSSSRSSSSVSSSVTSSSVSSSAVVSSSSRSSSSTSSFVATSASSSSVRQTGALVRTYTAVPTVTWQDVNSEDEIKLLPTTLSAVFPTTSSVSLAPSAPSIGIDSAYRITFYIYLKSTDTYQFVSIMDDTMILTLDGVPYHWSPFDTWGEKRSISFKPTESRFYLIDWMVYNGTSVGEFRPSIIVNGTNTPFNSTNFTIQVAEVVTPPPPASSSAASSSRAASSSSVAGGQTVTVQWSHPTQRENGQALPITEIGGYEIRQVVNGKYQYTRINNNTTTQYVFTYYGGTLEIAAFDTTGLYSMYVPVSKN